MSAERAQRAPCGHPQPAEDIQTLVAVSTVCDARTRKVDQGRASGSCSAASHGQVFLRVPADVVAFFSGQPLGLDAYVWCDDQLQDCAGVTHRVGKSQVAFARRRGFAYLWLPGQYLSKPQAEVVLSLALPERVDSPRWKEIAHPSPRTWMHHLEVQARTDLDGHVAGWLHRAWAAAD